MESVRLDVKNKVKHKIDPSVVAGIVMLIIIFSMLIAVCVLSVKESCENKSIKNQLERVQGGYRQSVLYDRDTKVMYLWDYRGGYTVMVDADGSPLLYEGE